MEALYQKQRWRPASYPWHRRRPNGRLQLAADGPTGRGFRAPPLAPARGLRPQPPPPHRRPDYFAARRCADRAAHPGRDAYRLHR
jgi:hypothetical protein